MTPSKADWEYYRAENERHTTINSWLVSEVQARSTVQKLCDWQALPRISITFSAPPRNSPIYMSMFYGKVFTAEGKVKAFPRIDFCRYQLNMLTVVHEWAHYMVSTESWFRREWWLREYRPELVGKLFGMVLAKRGLPVEDHGSEHRGWVDGAVDMVQSWSKGESR